MAEYLVLCKDNCLSPWHTLWPCIHVVRQELKIGPAACHGDVNVRDPRGCPRAGPHPAQRRDNAETEVRAVAMRLADVPRVRTGPLRAGGRTGRPKKAEGLSRKGKNIGPATARYRDDNSGLLTSQPAGNLHY